MHPATPHTRNGSLILQNAVFSITFAGVAKPSRRERRRLPWDVPFRPGDKRVIRPATSSDVPYLYKLQNDLHDYVGYCPRGGLEQRAGDGRLIVIEENGDPAGFLNFTHRRDRTTHVSQLAVDPQIWRTTAGTDTMRLLVQGAIAAGSRQITLRTALGLPANLFWPTFGFIDQGLVPGERRTLVCWSLALPQTSRTTHLESS